jgi:hypothetical protein
MKIRLNLIWLIITTLLLSCNSDYLETFPTDKLSDQVIFTSVEGAQTVLDGISRTMRAAGQYHDQFGVKTIDLAMDMMSEDIALSAFHWFGADYQFTNHTANLPRTLYNWSLFYTIIYNASTVIGNADHIESGPAAKKNNLKAQAYALRAYAYFQLVQLYQFTYKGNENAPGVPVYTENDLKGAGTDANGNQSGLSGKPRASVAEVYRQITADLDAAVLLFAENPVARRHISDITLQVAKGLRARVALVMNDWEKAASMAGEARQGYSLMTPAQYSLGFDNATRQNWMWGLEVNDEQSTTFGSWVSHMDWSVGGYCGFGLSRKSWSLALYNKMDNRDIRKKLVDITQYEPLTTKNWIIPNKYSAGKGKQFSADLIMMRPEEMLLIEAEAKARLNRTDEARALLKQLRDQRYDAPVTITASGNDLIEEILLERRIELWGEGFAALDLKRLKRGIDRNNSNHLPLVAREMSVPATDSRWNYQIPQAEIDANPNINAGQ